MDARSLLEKRLGEFLGFEDESLSDILEHLLSVESERDLRDYLSQLLGSEDDGIQDFVKDIGRFQRGEPILAKAENDEDHRSPPIANAAEVETKPTSSAGKVTTAQDKKSAATNQQQKAIIKDETATTIRAKESQLAPLNYGKTNVVPPLPQKTKTSATTKTEEATAQPAATVLSVKKKHGLPPKGEAKRNCGCFGTLHKPLTNCLYCGRIACEDEGYQFCPFCGYLVEEVKPSEGNSTDDPAWQHKERLLRYDRESAKRTVVFDDQADYYSNQTSNWLTEEEQDAAAEQDEEQRRKLHTRKKQTFSIAF